MKEAKWEQFARENPEYYVDTNFEGSKKDFFDSGRSYTARTLEKVRPRLAETRRALEIGCGVGRLTFPHAELFDEVIAVDVAPTMLQKLEEYATQFGADNIEAYLPHQSWYSKPVDFAYSYLVFQHIEDPAVIRRYIHRIASCLKAGSGLARLQFDTRPPNLLYKCRNKLPDWLLPETQRKGIRRIRRKPAKLQNMFAEQNLSVVQQQFVKTAQHTFLLQKI